MMIRDANSGFFARRMPSQPRHIPIRLGESNVMSAISRKSLVEAGAPHSPLLSQYTLVTRFRIYK